MDRPKEITEWNLNTHPHHDAITVISMCVARTNPQSVEANKASNFAQHIYEDLFSGKESQRVFYLTVAYLLGYVESTIESKYGPKIPKAVIPK